MFPMLPIWAFVVWMCVEVTFSNPGTEFLLTFPEGTHPKDPTFVHTERIYCSLDLANHYHDQDTTVTLTLFMNDPEEQMAATLTKENPVIVLSPPEMRQFPPGTVRGRKYLMRLVASHAVNVVVRNGGKSNFDTYLAIPVAFLGKSYLAFTYVKLFEGIQPASFVVIATTSMAASVKLKLPESYVNKMAVIINDVIMYKNNDVIEFTLSPYEAYQIQFPYGDVTGAFVESDEIVAVWSGTNRTSTSNASQSHAVEQAPPTSMAGTEFALFPLVYVSEGVPNSFDIYRIVNIHLNTELTLRHGVGKSSPSSSSQSSSPKESYFLSRPGTVLELTLGFDTFVSYINSSKPVVVYWVSPSAIPDNDLDSPAFGDVSTMWLPPLDVPMPTGYAIQLMPGDVYSKRQYISFVIAASSLGGMTLNGNDLNSLERFNLSLLQISGRPDLVAGSLGFVGEETKPDVYLLRQEDGVEFAAMFDGKANWDGEGHPLSYGTSFSRQDDFDNIENENETGSCCVTVNDDGIALYANECSDDVAPPHPTTCCIVNNTAMTCRRNATITTTCTLSTSGGGVNKRSSLNQTVPAKSILACHVTCFTTPGCLGVNFDPSAAPSPSSPNCQLLFGLPLGYDLEPTGPWRHVSCDQNVRYYFF